MSITTTFTEGKTLTVKRTLNAPRELVWEVWTKPEHIVQWWGPVGFTTTSQQMDMQAGGNWRFIMHGPDGMDYPNKIIFIEVIKPGKLVYRHSGDDDTEPVNFHVTVTFEADGNRTQLTMQSIFSSAEELERVNKVYGAIQGGIDTVNRLDEYLVNIKTGYQTGFTVHTTAESIFLSLTTKINEWWTNEMEGTAFNSNDIFTVRFGNTFKTFQVEEMIPNKKIIWKCIAAYIDVTEIENKSEWLETKIIWEIIQTAEATQLNMIHYGLTPSFDCYDICEKGWIKFINSLKNLLTTGKGMPYKKVESITA
ncbi:MAG: SRPBCC family protein [Bacteroidota bacterium]